MSLEIEFLGTGGVMPTPRRNVSSVAVRHLGSGEVIMVDCGEGTQRQLAPSSISMNRIGHVFLTHFHGDHFLGLPGLLQSMAMNERQEPLTIHAPVMRAERMVSALKVLYGHRNPQFPVLWEMHEDGDLFQTSNWSMRCIEARHSIPALSYVFEEADRPGKFDAERATQLGLLEKGPTARLRGELMKGNDVEHEGRTITPEMIVGEKRKGLRVAFSGDTRPNDGFIDAAQSVDLLIHEATHLERDRDASRRFMHTTASEAGKVAEDMKARRLILSHISPRYPDPLEHRQEARFEGATVAEDGDQMALSHRS